MLSEKNRFSNFSFTTTNADVRKADSYKRRIARAERNISAINAYLEKAAKSQEKLKACCDDLKEKLESKTMPETYVKKSEEALDLAEKQIEALTRRTEKEISNILTLTAKIIDNKRKLVITSALTSYDNKENSSSGASPSA